MLEQVSNKTYLKISDGRLRQKVAEGTPGSEARYVEILDDTVYEMVYKSITGIITGFYINDHDTYGRSYSLQFTNPDNDEEVYVVQFGEKSKYFQSFANKLPFIDLTKPVKLVPFSIAREKSNSKSQGITIIQDKEKLADYYKEYDKKTGKYTYKNGLEKFGLDDCEDKEDYQIAMIKVIKWYRKQVTETMDKFIAASAAENESMLNDTNDEDDAVEKKAPSKNKSKQSGAVKKADPDDLDY
jgi:hypothetical protein